MGNETTISELDQTIAHAVNARVEAEVLKALSGDEVIGRLVVNALQQEVEVSKQGGYGKVKVPFLKATIDKAIREAAKTAIAAVIEEEIVVIEEEVRKAVRRDARAIAEKFVEGMVDATSKGYRFRIEIPGRDW